MQRIVAPLSASDTGPLVVNLQNALLFILAHPRICSGEESRSANAQELTALIERVREERAQQAFGKATLAMVQRVPVQQGLGDGLGGVVEHKTAEEFNGLLKALETAEAQEGSLHPLAELRPSDWVDIVVDRGVPGGSSPEEYATALAADVEKKFPTSSPAADSATSGKQKSGSFGWWRGLSLWRGLRKRWVGR